MTPDSAILAITADPSFTSPPVVGNADNMTIFQHYLAFEGDAHRTAVACSVEVSQVQILAHKYGWDTKVAAFKALKKEGGAEALAVELNRVTCLTQAVRLRNMLDRVIRKVTQDDLSFESFLSEQGKFGSNMTARNARDLVLAVKTVHDMTFKALADSCKAKTQGDDTEATGDASLAIIKALAVMDKDRTPREKTIAAVNVNVPAKHE